MIHFKFILTELNMTNFAILEPGDKPPENIFNEDDDDITKQQKISLDSNIDMEPSTTQGKNN